ncbi:hypothetical protein ABKV19_026535 [Rosa sericea]
MFKPKSLNALRSLRHLNHSSSASSWLSQFSPSSSSSFARSDSFQTVRNYASGVDDRNHITFGTRRVLVPPRQAVVIKRWFGIYSKTLLSGEYFLIPYFDKIASVHCLKPKTINLLAQKAITKNNVSLTVTGHLTLKIVEPMLASYVVDNPIDKAIGLAQSTLCDAVGELTVEQIMEEQRSLNLHISSFLNDRICRWGLSCEAFEINDIAVPHEVKKAIEDLKATKAKRAAILESVADFFSKATKEAGGRRGSPSN